MHVSVLCSETRYGDYLHPTPWACIHHYAATNQPLVCFGHFSLRTLSCCRACPVQMQPTDSSDDLVLFSLLTMTQHQSPRVTRDEVQSI
jgi:hypothetical protein